MNQDIVIIIGAYGSGNSEYAINYAWHLKTQNLPVTLVDLDVVNPYFRSRQMRDEFSRKGILVIAPDGEFSYADMPMLSPRIMGAVQDQTRIPVLDVGGDPAGCRTLARYIENINKRGYQLQVVINTKRPFTSDFEGICRMLESLEHASRLKVTELVCNTNLMEFTNQNSVKNGIILLDQVAKVLDLKFDKYLVMDKFADRIPPLILNKKRVILQYFLNKPWDNSRRRSLI
jgi:hypothetical protein